MPLLESAPDRGALDQLLRRQMAGIGHKQASELLRKTFNEAENLLPFRAAPAIPDEQKCHFDAIFKSSTQAYREVLLGCIVVRLLDKGIDIRLPYVSQGDQAFNGRDLDEMVINPFLKEQQIPSSKGPYLSVFRRQVRFDESTRERLRDKSRYDAFLSIVSRLESEHDDTVLQRYLLYALYCFLVLREASRIPLARVHRLSVPQYESVVDHMLGTASGGLIPVLLVVAMFRALKEAFALDWDIDYQGVNVSDRSSQAAGDVTIKTGAHLVLGVEVTERRVDKARVVATFQSKIAPGGVEDYVFLVNLKLINDEAIKQAHQYFAQGHEVCFVDLRTWLSTLLVTIGIKGRSSFNNYLQELLADDDVPSQVKTAWNSAIQGITSR